MKKLYLFIAFVSILLFTCSCGAENSNLQIASEGPELVYEDEPDAEVYPYRLYYYHSDIETQRYKAIEDSKKTVWNLETLDFYFINADKQSESIYVNKDIVIVTYRITKNFLLWKDDGYCEVRTYRNIDKIEDIDKPDYFIKQIKKNGIVFYEYAEKRNTKVEDPWHMFVAVSDGCLVSLGLNESFLDSEGEEEILNIVKRNVEPKKYVFDRY